MMELDLVFAGRGRGEYVPQILDMGLGVSLF